MIYVCRTSSRKQRDCTVGRKTTVCCDRRILDHQCGLFGRHVLSGNDPSIHNDMWSTAESLLDKASQSGVGAVDYSAVHGQLT
jgi:hypothetical protein